MKPALLSISGHQDARGTPRGGTRPTECCGPGPLTRRLVFWLPCLALFLLGGISVFGAEAAQHAAPGALNLRGLTFPKLTFASQFGYSYLTAYMFFLSICLGSLFLVIMHHLFDAHWSVPIRRILEHIAFLLPWMGVLFIPIALLAKSIYPWMTLDPHKDHALHAKRALFNEPTFYVVAVLLFLIWTWLSYNLRKWSLVQDKTGDAKCTYTLRRYSAAGIYIFALTLTLAAIYWMKSIQHQFFSTMYGVYYFAGSVWTALGTIWLLALYYKKQGPLRDVIGKRQFHDIGTLLLVFTVFYAYIHFSQYFLIWNAAIPEETFWYVLRERGTWWDIGMIIIFGHFLIPFLSLLRIDVKLTPTVMIPLGIWVWLMQYADMTFNIMPALHPEGFALHWLDLACLAFIGFVLVRIFLKSFASHPPYPIRDPRLLEAMTLHEIPAAPISVVPEGGFK